MREMSPQCHLWTGALVAALTASSAYAQAPAAAPIRVPTEEQLAQYPRMTGFCLAPDGKPMISIESQRDVRNVLVRKTDNLSAKLQVIGASSMRITSASLLKNDVLAVTLWQPYDARIEGVPTKSFINKLMVTDLAGKEWKEPLASADIGRTDATRKRSALSVPTVKRHPSCPSQLPQSVA